MIRVRVFIRLWVIPIVVASICSPVDAEVLNIRSEIRSEVRSFISGELDSSDLAIENFGETGLALPIQAVARLEPIDDVDRLVAKAVGVADFRDPAVSVLSNPEEFGLAAFAMTVLSLFLCIAPRRRGPRRSPDQVP